MEKPDPVISDKISIQELKPDFVISALFTYDHKNESPTKEATLDLSNLLKQLISHGFLVQVRPGHGVESILVFVKLESSHLSKVVEKANVKDFLYGVNYDLFEEQSSLDEAEKLRIIYSYLTSDSGCGIKPTLGQWSFVKSVQPIHNVNANKTLIKKWTRTLRIEDKDIEMIKNQYGTKIALYFVFLKTYMKWLVFPAVIGLANFYFLSGERFSIIYTFLMLGWSVFFLQSWYKTEQNYSLRWDVKNLTSSGCSQTENLSFKPSKVIKDFSSMENAETFGYYPSHTRFLKKLAFVPVVFLFAVALISYQLLCFFIEIFIGELYDGPLKSILALTPMVMLSVFVPVLTMCYKFAARKFVAWENNKTMLNLETSMNEKMFVISFLTSYMALFITTFIYFPMGHWLNDYLELIVNVIHSKVHPDFPIKEKHFIKINPARMNGQFFFAMVTNQVIGFFLEYFLPFVLRFVSEVVTNIKKEQMFFDYNDVEEEESYLEEVRKQVYELGDYDVNDDFKQMVMQFGYLIFFSQCWTISPLICLVVNYIQFVGDLTKIFVENKRPIPTRTNSIYPWNQVLGLLVWLSSIIAPAISSMYRNSDVILQKNIETLDFSKSAVSIETWSLLTIIIVSEHLYLILNYVLSVFYRKVDSAEASADLEKSISLKKTLVAKTLQSVSIESDGLGDAIDHKWIVLKSDDEAEISKLAVKLAKNVKQSTKAKHSKKPRPAPAEPSKTPSLPKKTSEIISEKIGTTGAASVDKSGLTKRKL